MFFVNDTATTEIYTLSLHDALPICESSAATRRVASGGVDDLRWVPRWLHRASRRTRGRSRAWGSTRRPPTRPPDEGARDRKSTRLNSSHANISYAVFCLKKKTNTAV